LDEEPREKENLTTGYEAFCGHYGLTPTRNNPGVSHENGSKARMAISNARLTPLIRKTQPYARKIANKALWVEPEMLAEIEYRAKSAEGKVRHPFF
jgi:hypothetical protein